MMSYLLHALSFFSVMLIEFGLLNSMSTPFNLIPIGICVGIYHIFHLRPYLGGAWLLGYGIARDLHAVDAAGDIILAVLFIWVLTYMIEHHITHSSIYAATGTAAAVVFLWNALDAIISSFFSSPVPMDNWLKESLLASFVAGITMWILMLSLPRIRSVFSKYVRIKP